MISGLVWCSGVCINESHCFAMIDSTIISRVAGNNIVYDKRVSFEIFWFFLVSNFPSRVNAVLSLHSVHEFLLLHD